MTGETFIEKDFTFQSKIFNEALKKGKRFTLAYRFTKTQLRRYVNKTDGLYLQLHLYSIIVNVPKLMDQLITLK